MVQNPEYNKGKPYFIDFRPPLHQPTSIPKENISKIQVYNKKLDDIENKLKTFERQGIDTFTVKTELSLARTKLKNMQFAMLDAYIDSIEKKMGEM